VQEIEKVSSRKLNVPPSRGPVERRGGEQLHEPSPKTLKPSPNDVPHQPANEEKAGKHEPDVIRGGSNTPQQPSQPKVEPEKKQTEKPHIEPQPTEKPHGEPPPSERPRVIQQPAEKQPPRDGQAEKRGESRQEERKDEKDKKGEPGGN
jgi:hypothetical protein